MSVTSELARNDSPLRLILDTRLPCAAGVLDRAQEQMRPLKTMRSQDKLNYMLIGSALDYRLRLYFPVRTGGFRDLIAHNGAQVAAGGDYPFPECRPGLSPGWLMNIRRLRAIEAGRDPMVQVRSDCLSPRLMAWFAISYESAMSHLRPAHRRLDLADERTILRYCLVMAHLDSLFRVGLTLNKNNPLLAPQPKKSVAEILAVANEFYIDDMVPLSYAFYERMAPFFGQRAVCNPKSSGGRYLGGADADMILDKCLIDIKTSIHPRLTRLSLYQLIAYAILDLDNAYSLEKVAVYQSRQACLLEWQLAELIAELSGGNGVTLASLRKEVLAAYPVKTQYVPPHERLD